MKHLQVVSESTVFPRRPYIWKRTPFQVSHGFCLFSSPFPPSIVGSSELELCLYDWHVSPCDWHLLHEGQGICVHHDCACVGLSELVFVCLFNCFLWLQKTWVVFSCSFFLLPLLKWYPLQAKRLNGRSDFLHLHSEPACMCWRVEKGRVMESCCLHNPEKTASAASVFFLLRGRKFDTRMERGQHLAVPHCGWKSCWATGYPPSCVSS